MDIPSRSASYSNLHQRQAKMHLAREITAVLKCAALLLSSHSHSRPPTFTGPRGVLSVIKVKMASSPLHSLSSFTLPW